MGVLLLGILERGLHGNAVVSNHIKKADDHYLFDFYSLLCPSLSAAVASNSSPFFFLVSCSLKKNHVIIHSKDSSETREATLIYSELSDHPFSKQRRYLSERFNLPGSFQQQLLKLDSCTILTVKNHFLFYRNDLLQVYV